MSRVSALQLTLLATAFALWSCSGLNLYIASPYDEELLNARDVGIGYRLTSDTTIDEAALRWQCQLDDEPLGPCAYPHTPNLEAFGRFDLNVREGSHRFTLVATAGNGLEARATVRFRVEAPPPAVTFTSPRRAQVVTTRNVSVVFAPSPFAPDLTYRCAIDGGPSAPCTSPVAYADLGHGPHEVKVSLTDVDGEQNEGRLRFMVDLGALPRPAAVTQVSAGTYHACAALATGAVRCWGNGEQGRLGYANTNDIGNDEFPFEAGNVNVGAAVTSVVAASTHTCAVLAGGRVRCWGLVSTTTAFSGRGENP
jgi:hypothetical protein